MWRWHLLRRRIHDLEINQEISLPLKDYNLAHASVDRLNDAYRGERRWKLRRKGGALTVTRLENSKLSDA